VKLPYRHRLRRDAIKVAFRTPGQGSRATGSLTKQVPKIQARNQLNEATEPTAVLAWLAGLVRGHTINILASANFCWTISFLNMVCDGFAVWKLCPFSSFTILLCVDRHHQFHFVEPFETNDFSCAVLPVLFKSQPLLI
jgi:hypothetical protein